KKKRQLHIMDAFYGTWKVQLDKTTGVQEFGKLFGWTDEKISQFLSMEYTLQVQATADGTRCIVDYGVVKLEFSFKLGEPFDYTGVDGLKAKVMQTSQEITKLNGSYNGSLITDISL
ncbi:fatty acid-binding protein, heart, partial [Biomphalaria glabrata]